MRSPRWSKGAGLDGAGGIVADSPRVSPPPPTRACLMTTTPNPFRLDRSDLWRRFHQEGPHDEILKAIGVAPRDVVGLVEEFAADSDGLAEVLVAHRLDVRGDLGWRCTVLWNGVALQEGPQLHPGAVEAFRAAVGAWFQWREPAETRPNGPLLGARA